MRRSLAIRSLLVSAFLVAVFVVPLALLVRSSAEAQALTLGRSDARALTPLLSLAGDPRVAGQIDAVARRALPRILTVVFPDGSVLGDGEVIDRDSLADAVALARARAPETFQTHRHGGIILYEPVLRSNGSLARRDPGARSPRPTRERCLPFVAVARAAGCRAGRTGSGGVRPNRPLSCA